MSNACMPCLNTLHKGVCVCIRVCVFMPVCLYMHVSENALVHVCVCSRL